MRTFSLLLVSVLLMVQSSFSQVAREKVVIEVFTGVNCPYCPAAANGVKDMLAAGLNIAPIAIHTSSFSIPQFYTTETNARAQYYGVTSYPTAKFDGIVTHSGGGGAGQTNYSAYLSRYNQRVNLPSQFAISMSYQNVGGNNYEAYVTVEKVVPDTYTNIVFQLFLTESNIQYSWMGMPDLNWVTRDIIPTQNGTVLDFSSSNVVQLTLPFTMNPAWNKENCDLVAFVQNNTGKEIMQAKMLTLNSPEYTLDAELFSVMNIPAKMCTGLIAPEVVVKNKGAEPLTSLNIKIEVNGELVYTHPWTGSIAYTEKVHIVVPEFAVNLLETNQINVFVTDPNNGTDENPENDHHGFEVINPEIVNDYLVLIMSTDANPQHTSWEVLDPDGNVIDAGGPYTQPNQFFRDTVYYNGSIGCHRFIMYDAGGDGLTTYYTLRSYVNGVMKTIGNGSSFGFKETTHFSVDTGVGLDEISVEENSFEIFPNPVTNTSTVNFHLKQSGNVNIELFNTAGKRVMQLANGTFNSGINKVTLDSGELDNGIYFISIKTADQTLSGKIAIMK
mgnify:CR=1 FL=1